MEGQVSFHWANFEVYEPHINALWLQWICWRQGSTFCLSLERLYQTQTGHHKKRTWDEWDQSVVMLAVWFVIFWLRFTWRRNGKFFNIGKDPRVTMRKRSGTLEIGFRSGGRPEDYEGEYQCFANNEFGVALSNKILLRVSSKNPQTHTHYNMKFVSIKVLQCDLAFFKISVYICDQQKCPAFSYMCNMTTHQR